ncbi:Dbl homology domain-containing protein [Mycena metata]|uniref:Dbl homology domain-containing protein n=1 Tax=Mycena metata TaxID=1033252 RepID=A0AAD7K4S3_9AGAR|nr:Dbl homology domain-containing protein [Mycena metata]
MATNAVAFPVTGPQPTPRPRPPHLPFRRISLPSNINPRHRESVVSVASFESVVEEQPQRKRVVRTRGTDAREVKRRNVIQEFYETERAYVDGLELIYDHFLTPIIASLDTPTPLLSRADLAAVFSNFVDIWNLHRAFYAALSALLSSNDDPPLAPLLLSHFPYLSLYNPFVTSFPAAIAAIAALTTPNPQYNPVFAAYLREREADARCGKLKLRDWLLTIVQRCPRYLLLLKDLIGCTPPPSTPSSGNDEHTLLTRAHALVARITLTLNTSIHTHAQTLSLLALQRATPTLPFQLIVPGRRLVRRGALVHVPQEGNTAGWAGAERGRREREFLLFDDCLVWLEKESYTSTSTTPISTTPSGWAGGMGAGGGSPSRPRMTRTRSKSEAELPVLASLASSSPSHSSSSAHSSANNGNANSPAHPTPKRTASALPLPSSAVSKLKRPPVRSTKTAPGGGSGGGASGGGSAHGQSHEESGGRWVYKGRAELVDLEVVVPVARGGAEGGEGDSGEGGDGEEREEGRRFEVLSPEGSFVVYADSEAERDAWTSAVRQTKAALFVSLNATHPDSTLTSSASTAHLRRSLQALPFPPSDERLLSTGKDGNGKGKKHSAKRERRGRVEHWVPAIWIPDEKTEGCMRCGRAFGWRTTVGCG